jgi:hypothetical protein
MRLLGAEVETSGKNAENAEAQRTQIFLGKGILFISLRICGGFQIL